MNFFDSKSNNKVSINGKTYIGNNVTMKGNKIYVDGVEQHKDEKVINIIINGDLNLTNLEGVIISNITVKGNVIGSIKTTSGDINCISVNGSVVTVSGDVKVLGDILGSVSTVSGDIKRK